MITLPITDEPQKWAESPSAFAFVDPMYHCKVGCYSNGLFSVLSEEHGIKLLKPWDWVGPSAVALVSTAFGDVLYWQPSRGVFYLEAQRNHVEFVDTDLNWVLTEFLQQPEVVEQVFRKTYLDELVGLYRPLKYGEVFILQPWAMLGGDDQPKNYKIGDCDVYLHLVADAYSQ